MKETERPGLGTWAELLQISAGKLDFDRVEEKEFQQLVGFLEQGERNPFLIQLNGLMDRQNVRISWLAAFRTAGRQLLSNEGRLLAFRESQKTAPATNNVEAGVLATVRRLMLQEDQAEQFNSIPAEKESEDRGPDSGSTFSHIKR